MVDALIFGLGVAVIVCCSLLGVCALIGWTLNVIWRKAKDTYAMVDLQRGMTAWTRQKAGNRKTWVDGEFE